MSRDQKGQLTGLALIAAALAVIAALLVSERVHCDDSVPDVPFTWTSDRATHTARIEAWLDEFFANCNPGKLARARALVPTVVDAAERAGVNPSLVAAMVTLESSWQPAAVGKLGEVGLLQVMRSVAPVDDPAAQLDHGLSVLRDAYTRCGTTIGAVSLYATGKSCRPYRGARLRLRMAARIEGMR